MPTATRASSPAGLTAIELYPRQLVRRCLGASKTTQRQSASRRLNSTRASSTAGLPAKPGRQRQLVRRCPGIIEDHPAPARPLVSRRSNSLRAGSSAGLPARPTAIRASSPAGLAPTELPPRQLGRWSRGEADSHPRQLADAGSDHRRPPSASSAAGLGARPTALRASSPTLARIIEDHPAPARPPLSGRGRQPSAPARRPVSRRPNSLRASSPPVSGRGRQPSAPARRRWLGSSKTTQRQLGRRSPC